MGLGYLPNMSMPIYLCIAFSCINILLEIHIWIPTTSVHLYHEVQISCVKDDAYKILNTIALSKFSPPLFI